MAGRGVVEKIDQKQHPRILMLNKENNWVLAHEPMHFDKPERIGTGLGFAFAHAMAEHNAQKNIKTKIGLIPSAVGGSSISVWKPGGFYKTTQVHPYDDAIKRAKIAMESGTLKAILWHQGESDSSARKAPHYKQALITLAAGLRQDLQAPDIPFIVGGLGGFVEKRRPQSVQINAILQDAPNFIPNTVFVSASGLKDKGDNLHFNSASYRALGKRYAEVLQNMPKP